MKQELIKDIININKKGSAQRSLLEQFIAQGSSTIPELAKSMGISLPTVTKALNELMEKGLVHEVGKKDNAMGRIPIIYDLNPHSGYFLGISPENGALALGISDFCGNMVAPKTYVSYAYEDTPECFDNLCDIVTTYIDNAPIDKSKLLNICMNVAERVNPFKGTAYNTFTFLDNPLAQVLSERINFPVCIENDTRSMTYGEYVKGCAKGLKNVIFVNVCWGIGIGIIIDGKLYYGKSGYSGEFGHMPIYNNGIICHCGKIGCVETETSGWALQKKLTKLLLEGRKSVLSNKVVNRKEELRLKDILRAIEKEDVLSQETLQTVADELGKNLAGVINIFNPEMLVVGGEMSVTGDYLTLPISLGIKKYSLNIMNEDSKIVTSELKDMAGVIGACLMARYRLLSI